MRFFERWSGKRAADSSQGQFARFAARAAKDHASSEIALLDVMQVVDALAEALAKRYPELDQAAANDFAVAGLRLHCHRCGLLGGQAVHTLYLAGSGVLDGSFATGPGAARLGQGRCPGCGSTTAVAEFFARDARDRAEQLRKAKRASRAEARGKGQLLPACPAIPYQNNNPYFSSHDFDVSPDGSLVCCLTTDGRLAAFETGTDRPAWTAPVPSTDGCLFRFVGVDRLLVLSGPSNERGQILLINTSDGSVVDSTNPIKLEYDVGDSEYRKGLFVGRETHRSLLFVNATGDRIVVSPLRVDVQIGIGPRIGPDGNAYFGGDIWAEWHCVENGQDRVFCSKGRPYNCLCIGFESATRVYLGGGYYDRSGESALLIADPTTGEHEMISWDREPIDEIACFGNGLLLLANATSKANPAVFPNAVITCFSAQKKQRVWTQSFVPRKPLRRVILATAPEQGWALVQTGAMFKVIDVADGKVIRVLDKPSEEYVNASWVASRSLVYISGTPGDRKPGLLECYRF